MPSTRLSFTDRRVEDLTPPPQGRQTYLDWDDPKTKKRTAVSGLQLRVYYTGVKAFVLCKRFKGRTLRVTLGRFPAISVSVARELARSAAENMAKGVNPNKEKQAERIRGITLEETIKEYLKNRTLAEGTKQGYQTIQKKYFYDWLAKPLNEITRDMVMRRHTAITDGTLKPSPGYSVRQMKASATAANKAMRFLRSVYNFAQLRFDDGSTPVITDNPVVRITALKKWNKETSRGNRLYESDFAPWFDAVLSVKNRGDEFADTVADFLVFLLMTGLRRREATNLKWADVNPRARFITIWKTKNHQPHKLPLTDYLAQMLEDRRQRVFGEYVFPSGAGNDCLDDPRRLVDFVRGQAGVYFTLHDLRRTFASVAESLDISAYALKRLLNHSDGRDVTGVHYIKMDIERLRKPMQIITDYYLSAAGIADSNLCDMDIRRASV